MVNVAITWLGHGTFVLRADDQFVLIDPWVMQNPACPPEVKEFPKIDTLLITHGHHDHVADAVHLARRYQPSAVVATYELCEWLGRKGVENLEPMNKGGTIEIGDMRITMVHADHSSGILEDDGSIIYGGEAVGFVIETGSTTLYHAGDTNVFGDMALIGELYRPDIAVLPIGGRFTMGPREAAKATALLGASRVIPMSYGTFPQLTGTPEALREQLKGAAEVIELAPGEHFQV